MSRYRIEIETEDELAGFPPAVQAAIMQLARQQTDARRVENQPGNRQDPVEWKLDRDAKQDRELAEKQRSGLSYEGIQLPDMQR